MPHRLRATCVAVLLAGVSFVAAAPAQTSREAEQKLQRVRSELKSIAQERRKLEGERGAASRQLREADEKVGRTSRSLAETEAAMRREAAALAELQQRRDTLQAQRQRQRAQLGALVRAAYQQGGDAPLKVLLSQDRVADANRLLAYHRYVQRDQARRIDALTADLASLDEVEREIASRRAGSATDALPLSASSWPRLSSIKLFSKSSDLASSCCANVICRRNTSRPARVELVFDAI